MKKLRGLVLSCTCSFLLLLAASALWAGKPGSGGGGAGGGGDPVDPREIYEYRADLGGWLDTRRNLVWGTYSITSCLGGAGYYDQCTAAAADYVGTLLDGADMYEQERQYALARYQSDPVRYEWMLEYAADNAYARDELLATAVGAMNVEGTNKWRMPTKDEFVDAYKKGYFTYGESGLNAFDVSPFPEVQSENAFKLHWTATADKGNRSQWAIDPPTGTLQSVLKGSILFAVAVRTYTPPATP